MGSKISDRQREVFGELIDNEINCALIMRIADLPKKVTEAKDRIAEDVISQQLEKIREEVLGAKQFGFNLRLSIDSLVPGSKADADWDEYCTKMHSALQKVYQLRIDLHAGVWVAETVNDLRSILAEARRKLVTAFD